MTNSLVMILKKSPLKFSVDRFGSSSSSFVGQVQTFTVTNEIKAQLIRGQ